MLFIHNVWWFWVRDAAWPPSAVVRLQCRSKSLSPCWFSAVCLASQTQVAGQGGWYIAGNCEVTPGQILALSRHSCPVTHLCDVWGSFVSHGCFSFIVIDEVNMASRHMSCFGKAFCSQPCPRLPYWGHGSGKHFIRFYLPRRRLSRQDFWRVLSKSGATSRVIGPFESTSCACVQAWVR